MTPSILPSPPAACNLRIMRALFHKDWRFFRVPMVALLIASGLWILYSLLVWGEWMSRPADMERATSFLDLVDAAAAYGAGVVALIAAAFGGMAIAGERADSAADFLAMLPVTRLQIAISKWLVSLVMLGTGLLIPGLVATWFYFHGTPGHAHDNGDQFFRLVAMYGAFAVGFFGVAWLLGVLMQSAPISACVGIAVILAAVTVTEASVPFQVMGAAKDVVAAGMGLAGTVVGTICYLRRVSP